MEYYHHLLCKEITLFAQKNPDLTIKTIYFGGGTPSTYPINLLLDMSGRIRGVFNIDQLEEVTIEVNPGTVALEHMDAWIDAGINRLSIGVQYDDKVVLSRLNRHQTVEDVYKLFAQAEHKFENISVDVMLGLPGVNVHQWKNFMKRVVAWPIKHLSLYCLMVHENTPLFFKVQRNEITLLDEKLCARLYCWSVKFLQKHGFYQYEVSNFARPGYESRHNNVYWDRKPYKGFGLGACSFDGKRRFTNDSNFMRYKRAIEEGQEPIVYSEELTAEQIRLEKIMLGLRRNMGIDYRSLMENVSLEKSQKMQVKISNMCKAGLLEQHDDVVRLTPEGFVVEQEIIAQLI